MKLYETLSMFDYAPPRIINGINEMQSSIIKLKTIVENRNNVGPKTEPSNVNI